jgi:cation diffusion facilitator family transporter
MTEAASMHEAAMRAEQRMLRLSTIGAAVFAVAGIGWGYVAGSQVILLDGVYALVGVLLAGLSLRVARVVQAGPTARYPFGREALGPLVVGVQGLVLLGSLGYAVIDAVLVISGGGSETAFGAALAYAVVSAAAALVIWRILMRGSPESELVAAEGAQWFAGLLLSVGMFAGFGAALLLEGTSADALVAYIDPAMVIAAAALIAPTPLRMLAQMWRELLEGAPPSDVADPVMEVVRAVSEDEGLPEPTVRMGKLGRKLYVEVDYLVAEGRWSIAEADHVRRLMMARLREPGRMLWINVELHTDPDWDVD